MGSHIENKNEFEAREISSENISSNAVKCLTDVRPGSTVKVVRIDAGQQAKTRLSHLGITPDTAIKLESTAPFYGPVCVQVRGTTLCIGRGLAKKCVVETISEE